MGLVLLPEVVEPPEVVAPEVSTLGILGKLSDGDMADTDLGRLLAAA